MKKLTLILASIITVVAMSVPSHAGLRIGPRVGVALNELHFNTESFNPENRAGFTGGLEIELGAPLGICLDASVMYVRRSIDATNDGVGSSMTTIKADRDYINVPINLKWRFGLPIIGKITSPYLFTGPDFAFLCSKQAISEAWESKKVDISWNFGVGVQLFNHLQVGASYGLGITELANKVGFTTNEETKIKNNFWTITAAWLF